MGHQGLDLIVDRLTALLDRISATQTEHMTPPTTVGDERLSATLEHWKRLASDAVNEARKLALSGEFTEGGRERLTALLALPRNTREHEIVRAVELMVDRLQKLELRVVNPPESSSAVILMLQEQITALEARVTSLEDAFNRGNSQ